MTNVWNQAKDIITQGEKNYLVNISSGDYKGTNIINNGTCESLVLTDGASFAPAESFTATAATYTRTMPTISDWGTIILPFATTAPEGVTLYQISSVTDGNLVVSSIDDGKLAANTPALFKTPLGEVTFTGSGNVTADAAGTTTVGNLQLIGSYEYGKQITDDYTYYIKSDQFWTKDESFYCDAFRAYIKTDGSVPSPSFSIVVDDDPTGIASAGASVSDEQIEAIYSVSGVKTDDLKKGINIVRYRSGKTRKVILK